MTDKMRNKIARAKLDAEQAARTLKSMLEGAYEGSNGELRWKSNDNPIPMHCFKETGIEAPENQQAEIDAHTTAFLKEYREQMKDYQPSEEELFEMRAAFGPGETVVNVVTGQRIKL
jgi:hypothetical protein